jgi:hypothetical protein
MHETLSCKMACIYRSYVSASKQNFHSFSKGSAKDSVGNDRACFNDG